MKINGRQVKLDLGARFFKIIHDTERTTLHFFYTFIQRLESRIVGVKLGKNVSFNGCMMIDRFKGSYIEIGDNCTFNSHSIFNPRGCRRCIIHTGKDFARIRIGKNSGFSGVAIVARKEIVIGDNVTVGADSQIGDSDGHNDILGTQDASVFIGNNVFIGMHCMIMKGVTIGDNSIIAAGSIVTKDIPANCIAGGVPCKVIRRRG